MRPFDLDGTLADTLPDISTALNVVLRSENRAAISSQDLRDMVSHGTTAMLKYAFGAEQSAKELDKRHSSLLEYYAKNFCVDTPLFAEISYVLDELQSLVISCGIITYKPANLTYPLLQQLNIEQGFCSIICGDTLAI